MEAIRLPRKSILELIEVIKQKFVPIAVRHDTELNKIMYSAGQQSVIQFIETWSIEP